MQIELPSLTRKTRRLYAVRRIAKENVRASFVNVFRVGGVGVVAETKAFFRRGSGGGKSIGRRQAIERLSVRYEK